MVVSPARTDLAEGSSLRIDLLPDIVVARAQPSEAADAKPSRSNLGNTRSSWRVIARREPGDRHYLPSTGVEVSPRRRKRGAILMSFL